MNSTFYSLNGDELQTKMMKFDKFDLEETKFNYTHSKDLNAKVCYSIGTMQREYLGWIQIKVLTTLSFLFL